MTSKRPSLPKVSEEMKRWSALLADEMKRWPETSVSSLFGMISVYRGDTIFALLPGTRGLDLPNAIATKLNGPGKTEREKWDSFTIEADKELGAVLRRLEGAYRQAKTTPPT
jgi:hypothetical protein